ncbi:hypothetical protein PAMP_015248 [Pampus punctatissimus]
MEDVSLHGVEGFMSWIQKRPRCRFQRNKTHRIRVALRPLMISQTLCYFYRAAIRFMSWSSSVKSFKDAAVGESERRRRRRRRRRRSSLEEDHVDCLWDSLPSATAPFPYAWLGQARHTSDTERE